MSNYTNMSNPKLALNFVQEEFKVLTRQFDLEDWRTVRNRLYWQSVNILSEQRRWEFKNELISHYNKTGKPLVNINQLKSKYTIVKRENGYEYTP